MRVLVNFARVFLFLLCVFSGTFIVVIELHYYIYNFSLSFSLDVHCGHRVAPFSRLQPGVSQTEMVLYLSYCCGSTTCCEYFVDPSGCGIRIVKVLVGY